MDSILNSTQLLAHWVYSSGEAEQSARREYIDYQERNHAMFFIIGGMLVVGSLIMIIFAGERGHCHRGPSSDIYCFPFHRFPGCSGTLAQKCSPGSKRSIYRGGRDFL